MSDAEYASWRQMNDAIPHLSRAAVPCADCPIEWMQQQAEAGTCNRRSHVPMPGGRCGYPMPKLQEPCARYGTHGGTHRGLDDMERRRVQRHLEYVAR